MALSTMYPAKANSPQTTLAAGITAADTSMTLSDASILPAAPNLCTLGADEDAEVVSYTTITGNVVSGLIRGSSGTTASVWPAGTVIARDYTSYDHDTFILNITDLNSTKANTADLGTMASVDDAPNDSSFYLRYQNGWSKSSNTYWSKTALRAILCSAFSTAKNYAIGDYVFNGDLIYRFITAHSAGAWNADHVVQVQTMTEVQKKVLYYSGQSVSAATNAQIMRIPSGTDTDSRITADTIVLECTFTDPSKITSNVTWNSYDGYITFIGTCTAGTSANVTLGQKGN